MKKIIITLRIIGTILLVVVLINIIFFEHPNIYLLYSCFISFFSVFLIKFSNYLKNNYFR
jgi:uncharacterized membrane protein YccC